MILNEVKMENFKVFRNDKVDFTGRNITVITGPNGVGKTSIIEAVTYALFGRTQSLETKERKVTDLIRVSGEGRPERQMSVTVKLEIEGHEFTVKRSHGNRATSSLDVWIDGRRQNISSTRSGDELVQRTLRMDYQSFINSTIVRQGEMDRLTRMRGSERKKVFADLFNLDIYGKLDEKTKDQREENGKKLAELQGRIDELTKTITRGERFSQQLAEMERRKEEAENEANALQAAAANAASELLQLEEKQGEFIRVENELETLKRHQTPLEKRLEARKRELEDILKAERILGTLEPRYQDYQARLRTLESLEPTIRSSEQLLQGKLRLEGILREEKAKLEAEITTLDRETREIKELTRIATSELQQIPHIEAQLEKVSQQIENKGDVLHHLTSLREEAARTEAVLGHLEEECSTLRSEWEGISKIGVDAPCPLCKQRLSAAHLEEVGKEYAVKIKDSEDLAAQAEQDIQRIRSEIAALEAEEAVLKTLDTNRRNLEDRLLKLLERRGLVSEKEEKAGLLQARRDELKSRLESQAYAEDEKSELEGILDRLSLMQPGLKEYEDAKPVADQYRKERLETAYAAVQETARRKPAVEADTQTLKNELDSLLSRIPELERMYDDIKGVPREYRRKKQSLDMLRNELDQARGRQTEALTKVGTLRNQIEEVDEAKRRLSQDQQQLAEITKDEEALTVLRSIFADLPVRILDRLRPNLALEASDIIATVTQNEFSEVDLEDDFAVKILHQGGYRDINWFSGGQQVKVNMALRVAVAKMLAALPEVAEQLPARQQTLIIDEGDFGSLDAEGIDAASEAIRNLGTHFQRVILVTHIQALKEAFPDSIIEIKRVDQGESAVVPI